MGQPILTYPLGNRVDAGIRQEVQAGFTSQYECREAAKFSLYNWDQWLDLNVDERAMCIAHYRLSHAIEANVMDAHNRHNERLARRRRR